VVPSGWLPSTLYARLEECLGCRLRESHRQLIETGIGRALIDRDVQLDDSIERRTLYAELEQGAAVLERTLSQTLTFAHFPMWLIYLGAEETLRNDVLRGAVDPRVHLRVVLDQVRMVRRGATWLLKGPAKGRGARKRRERDLMCFFIAHAMSDATGWPFGGHQSKVVSRFARLLYTHIPKAVAHKSAGAFAEHLCKVFELPDFGREKFTKVG
jgi:hypothetical protein